MAICLPGPNVCNISFAWFQLREWATIIWQDRNYLCAGCCRLRQTVWPFGGWIHQSMPLHAHPLQPLHLNCAMPFHKNDGRHFVFLMRATIWRIYLNEIFSKSCGLNRPPQLSKSCTVSAPAATCPFTRQWVVSVIICSNWCASSGWVAEEFLLHRRFCCLYPAPITKQGPWRTGKADQRNTVVQFLLY